MGSGGPHGGARLAGAEREQGPAGGGGGERQRRRGRVDAGPAGGDPRPERAAARGPRAQQRPQAAAGRRGQDLALEEASTRLARHPPADLRQRRRR